MGMNLKAHGRKLLSVPAVAAILARSVNRVGDVGGAGRLINMTIRNLDTVNTVTLKPQGSDDNITFADLDANSVATRANLGATAGDTLAIKPGGSGSMAFSCKKLYYGISGSGGPALIEVHTEAQQISDVEGLGVTS